MIDSYKHLRKKGSSYTQKKELLNKNKAVTSFFEGQEPLTIGGLALALAIDPIFNFKHNLASRLSGWVGSSFYVANVDNFNTFPVFSLDGNLAFVLDSELNFIINNLDLKDGNTFKFFNDIQNKIEKYKKD